MLKIKELKAQIEENMILKGINLEIDKNEVHVIMGPNGSGKSTLSRTLMGAPEIEVKGGEVLFESQNITEADPSERAQKGLFLANQYPTEIPGVSLANFLRLAYNSVHQTKLSVRKFKEILEDKLAIVGLDQSFQERNLNEGFSGGEKKKSEILQLAVLEPKLAILDETDSGLDVEALSQIFSSIQKIQKESGMSLLIITHYDRVLDYIAPDYVHIMKKGKIVKTGGVGLVSQIQEKGFKQFV